jgi:hypothetical protein
LRITNFLLEKKQKDVFFILFQRTKLPIKHHHNLQNVIQASSNLFQNPHSEPLKPSHPDTTTPVISSVVEKSHNKGKALNSLFISLAQRKGTKERGGGGSEPCERGILPLK